ncbi:class I SAM-dependent methyltransferase [Candidatus Pacearchaeota archaeon]|nr:class I SAM-dependent methyltransferase [Candidatus Pacearchaeota archaeon]
MTQISECLRQYRQIKFNRESKYQPYCVNRNLHQYVEELPKFQGKNLLEIVDEKIISKNGSPVQILDIGCGQGKFLLDCKEKWGSHINCAGLSAFPYHEEEASLFPYTEELSLNSVLKKKRVDIKTGDVHRLYESFPKNNFDIITSSTAFRYFAHPAVALKMIYQALNHNGICLVNDFSLSRNFRPYVDDLNKLHDFLRETYGFEFHKKLWGLSFQKRREKLSLPVLFDKRPDDKLYTTGFDAEIVYRLKI